MFSDFDNTHTDMQYMINLNNWVLLGICLVHSLGWLENFAIIIIIHP